MEEMFYPSRKRKNISRSFFPKSSPSKKSDPHSLDQFLKPLKKKN